MYQTNLNWFEMHKIKEDLMWAQLLPKKTIPLTIAKKYDPLDDLSIPLVFLKGALKGMEVGISINLWFLFFYILYFVCKGLSGG
jgi:hypothetical protein